MFASRRRDFFPEYGLKTTSNIRDYGRSEKPLLLQMKKNLPTRLSHFGI